MRYKQNKLKHTMIIDRAHNYKYLNTNVGYHFAYKMFFNVKKVRLNERKSIEKFIYQWIICNLL